MSVPIILDPCRGITASVTDMRTAIKSITTDLVETKLQAI
jgi:hypothetical protein